jgi:hypothetical protein
MPHDCPIYDPDPKRRDPVDPSISDMMPNGRNAGQNLTGTQMSVTQLRRGGLLKRNKIYR